MPRESVFLDNGFGKPDVGGTFLVGYNGKLYAIQNDFQVGIPAIEYDAVGCGANFALGALHATKNKRPEDRVMMALEAAATFSAGVAPPFKVIKLAKKK